MKVQREVIQVNVDSPMPDPATFERARECHSNKRGRAASAVAVEPFQRWNAPILNAVANASNKRLIILSCSH